MNNDLISRSALLGRIKPPQEDDERSAVLMSDVRRIIHNFVMAAPAVDAETVFQQVGLMQEAFDMAKSTLAPVRHGRWEECDWVEYDGHSECVRYPKKGRVCTSCRNAFKKEFIDNPRVNYCPNCGCKMDGDSHDA